MVRKPNLILSTDYFTTRKTNLMFIFHIAEDPDLSGSCIILSYPDPTTCFSAAPECDSLISQNDSA